MRAHALHPDFERAMNISRYFRPERHGGQKSVYFPVINGEQVVLKIIQGGRDDRFEREMSIYEKFKLSGDIPKVKEILSYGNDTIVIEEFIDGNTLSDIVPTYSRNATMIKLLMNQICGILKPIWEARYVHRDLKPDNIIIRPSGSPVIIDFGIARDLGASSITGAGFQPKSWPFASPEQYEGNKTKISYRTDFFSLGIIAYYLFHQALPFGRSEAEVAAKFASKNESFNCDPTFSLEPFCRESLKFSPVERPRFVDDLINLL